MRVEAPCTQRSRASSPGVKEQSAATPSINRSTERGPPWSVRVAECATAKTPSITRVRTVGVSPRCEKQSTTCNFDSTGRTRNTKHRRTQKRFHTPIECFFHLLKNDFTSATPRRSRYPAVRASPSTPIVAIAPTGTPSTTYCIRPRLRWLSE